MAGLPLSRGAAVLAGGGAFVAADGLLSFSTQVLLALGVGPDDALIRLLAGYHIEPWNLRSIVWAVLFGAAAAAFLPPLVRGLAGGAMSLVHALIVGTLAAVANLVVLDLVQNDRARYDSNGWQLALVLVGPLAAGVLAELSSR